MKTVDFKKFNCKRCFGLEIEVGKEKSMDYIKNVIKDCSGIPVKSNYYRATVNNFYWDLKHDGSCGKKTDKFGINEGGYEINTFKASSLTELLHICHVAKNLKQSGLQINKNCGLHIHIDAHDFSEEQMGVLISNWLCIERTMMQSVPYTRRRNKYCQKLAGSRYPVKATFENAIAVWDAYKPRSTKLHDNSDRRLAMNLVNYFRFLKLKNFLRSTIEFRFPEGTLLQTNVKNWTRILVNFVNKMAYEKQYKNNIVNYNVAQTLEVLGLGGDKESFYILSPGLFETKKWFLKRIMRFADYANHDLAAEAKEILSNMEY